MTDEELNVAILASEIDGEWPWTLSDGEVLLIAQQFRQELVELGENPVARALVRTTFDSVDIANPRHARMAISAVLIQVDEGPMADEAT